MKEIYEKIKTPYKFGAVIKDEEYLTDSPSVFKYNDKWYMYFIKIHKVTDDSGYETHFASSDDLVNWSEPIYVMQGDEYFGHHYVAVFPEDKESPISVLTDNCFSVLKNGNGTDVLRQHIEFANK